MKPQMKMNINNLIDYIDYLQSKGIYVFTRKQAKQTLGCSSAALHLAIYRLISKKRIIRLRRNFYVIIPLEYKKAGAPPPSWYIDFFMKYYKLDYYVGLLSAAALYGAAHQQPQEFQVITTKPIRPIFLPRTRISFFVKNKIINTYIIKKQTETGYILVSSPELTAIDLVQYVEASGHLSNVVTVLIELVTLINIKKLLLISKKSPLMIIQRLGFLLEQFTDLDVEPLHKWLTRQNIRSTPLRPDKSHQGCERNLRWKIWVNEKVEPDL